jgi:hypothetical protein
LDSVRDDRFKQLWIRVWVQLYDSKLSKFGSEENDNLYRLRKTKTVTVGRTARRQEIELPGVGGGNDFTEQGSRAFTVIRFPIYQSANNCGTSDKERPVSQNQEYTTLAMKVAFVVPPISGHLNPMTTLARELQSRDHDVVIISLPDGEASVRAAGLTFLPCAAKEFPAGSLKERFRKRSKLKGEEALRAILQSAAGRTEAS